MLTAFYIIVAALTLFVILSLCVVRAHEKKVKEASAEPDAPPKAQEEFFRSPIYRAMEVIAHL